MIILETERLSLREFEARDSEFILELLNEPGWKKYIGDRGITDIDGARNYIDSGPSISYAKNGFGLWAMDVLDSRETVGMCGLIKRDTLEDVDIGFALLERFEGRGYAREAALATLDFAKNTIGLKRVVAITTEDNHRSGMLLEKIGLKYERPMVEGDKTLRLYAVDLTH